MAGPKGSKYYDIFLKQQIQLVTKEDDIVINEEGFTLLTEIKKEQSIVAASRKMGISYRKAGGKTDLTQEGIELTEAYGNLKRDLDYAVHDTVKTFFNSINKLSDRK